MPPLYSGPPSAAADRRRARSGWLSAISGSAVGIVLLALAILGTASAGTTVALSRGTHPRRPAAAPPPSPDLIGDGAQAVATGPGASGQDTAAAGSLAPIVVPDLLVTTPAPINADQLAALGAAVHPSAQVLADSGVLGLPGGPARALGVDPGQFRPFTPGPTAASDPMWASVSRGELAVSYDVYNARRYSLGVTLPVGPTPVRLGSVANFGLPKLDALVGKDRSGALRLVKDAALLLSTPGQDPGALAPAVTRVLGGQAEVTVLTQAGSARAAAPPPFPAPAAPAPAPTFKGKPRNYRELYMAAATTCSGLSWTVLAGIGQVETDHGRNKAVSSAGAMGPMQFLPETFRRFAVDGDGDGVANILDPFDAVYTAARYLCSNGAGQGGQSLYNAVFAYNHADFYVREVLALAAQYH